MAYCQKHFKPFRFFVLCHALLYVHFPFRICFCLLTGWKKNRDKGAADQERPGEQIRDQFTFTKLTSALSPKDRGGRHLWKWQNMFAIPWKCPLITLMKDIGLGSSHPVNRGSADLGHFVARVKFRHPNCRSLIQFTKFQYQVIYRNGYEKLS